ncbi:MAG: nitroreductase family deazaflavin-dependent oxidoreductase [Dermatophilaceae bacterium]
MGAKTGLPRAVCVLGFPTSQGVVVAAGNFGQQEEPAWCANLRRHPRARLEQGRLTRPVVAHELSGDARAAAWRQCLTVYPGGAQYARRSSSHRPVPSRPRSLTPDRNPTAQIRRTGPGPGRRQPSDSNVRSWCGCILQVVPCCRGRGMA